MLDALVKRRITDVPVLLKNPPLVNALNQSEQVTIKVEECADELASVNAVLKQEIVEYLPTEKAEQALHQSEVVEAKIEECADELSLVNQALGKELRERKKLERKLAEGQIELAATQNELSNTQVKEKHTLHLALHDVVTGLPNRSLFNDRLNNALLQAQRHNWQLAVMFIDLDKFKNVNDIFGHGAGDKVLQLVSERVKSSVRGADTVGRHGGDKFLYLMLEVKNPSDVASTASKIIENIAPPCAFDGLNLTIEASIGIAIYPQDGKSANVLIKNADSALYKAKQQSDKRYCFYN